MSEDAVRLSVTGLGLACSLGLQAPDACAAAFAGLTRPSPMPGVDVFDPEEALGTDLNVHAAPFITEGFADVARYARLAEAALADLARRTEIPEDNKTGICIALPSGSYVRQLELAPSQTGESLPRSPRVLSRPICAWRPSRWDWSRPSGGLRM
ncbi:MAG: hypothetical protein AAF170_13120 [Bacteroidota bacterium]